MSENKIDIKNIETLLKELIAQLKHNHSGILLAAIHTLLKTPGIDQSLNASLQEALAKLSLSEAFVDYTKRSAEKMPDERALMIAEIEVLYQKYEDASKNFIKALDEVSSDEFLAPYYEDIEKKNKAYQAAKGTHHEYRAHSDLMESVNRLKETLDNAIDYVRQAFSNAKNECEEALSKAENDPNMKEHCNVKRQNINSMSKQCDKGAERCNDKVKNKLIGLGLTNNEMKFFESPAERNLANKSNNTIKAVQNKNSYSEGMKPSACKTQVVRDSRQQTNNIKIR